MKAHKNITGIILAGGKSSRMGHDKGLVMYKNQPFIQHIINALTNLVDEIIIVSDNSEYDIFKVKRVPDIIKNAGPLAGLYSGLQSSKTEHNLVLSCDVPLVSKQLLQTLIKYNTDEIDVLQFQSNNKTTPLIALYKKRCSDSCLKTLESGEKRLRYFIKQLHSKTITVDNILKNHIANINTKDELKQLNNDITH